MPMWLSRTLRAAVVRVLIDAAFATPWTRRGTYRYRHFLVPLTAQIVGDAPKLTRHAHCTAPAKARPNRSRANMA